MWNLRLRRSGKERFGRSVETGGLRAIKCDNPLHQGHTVPRVSNGYMGGENGVAAMTDGVATIGVRKAGSVAAVAASDMPKLGRCCLGCGRVMSSMICGGGVFGLMNRRRVMVSHRVRVRADNRGKDQRKRRHGCKPPCRPRFCSAAHRKTRNCHVRSLMAVHLAEIKTAEPTLGRGTLNTRLLDAGPRQTVHSASTTMPS
jgi:hypothetical protein